MLPTDHAPSEETESAPPDQPAGSAESEILLLQRLAGRDTDAIGEAYSLYGSLVFSYALRTVGNRQDAEEILQDTFVKIWEKAGDYRPDLGRPFTWIFMVARGLCLDRLRSTGRRRRRLQSVASNDLQNAPAMHATPRIFPHDELRRALDSLRHLPAPDRKAVEMAIFLEFTGPEIADRTHEPLGTVKSRVRRGLARLRHLLAQTDP